MIDFRPDGCFRVTCERCGVEIADRADLREFVVLQLLRARWRVRGGAHTWCPSCAAAFSRNAADDGTGRERS